MIVSSGSERARARLVEENEIPSLPPGWDVQRFRFLFRESKERNGGAPVGEMLSVSEYRGVVPKEYDREEHRRTDEELQTYRVVRPGQLAVNTMWLNHLGLGVSDHLGHVSPAYAVFDILEGLERRFVHHLLRSQYYLKIYLRYLYGIRPNSFQIKTDDWNSIPIILPPLETQKAIADFLDRETARIDQLIEKKEVFVTGIAKRIEALIDEALSDKSLPWLRFENITRRIRRPVRLSEHDELVRLGLYNRGRGLFKKPAADEEGMGDSDFYFIEEGDLVISGQFAWEGAVALAFREEEGCVVSHRYPVYRGKKGVKTAYLLGFLRSSYGDFILNEASRGSAGRNRPLNTSRLAKEKVPVPSDALQGEIERSLLVERQIKDQTRRSIMLLQERRASLITAAVTGQIDVGTWGSKGTTDSRLDAIEAEMEQGVKELKEARA